MHMRRYLDTFYRYWFVVLIPVILFPAAGVIAAKRSHGFVLGTYVYADDSTLKQLGYANAYTTPADNFAQDVAQFLASPSFVRRVLQAGPLHPVAGKPAPAVSSSLTTSVSHAIAVTASGPNLVAITYTSASVPWGLRVLQGLIKATPKELAIIGQKQQDLARAAAEQHVKSAREQLHRASLALGKYLKDHGIAPAELTSAALVNPEVATLYEADQSSEASLQAAEQALAQIRSQSAPVQQGLRVVDAPHLVGTVSPTKKLLLYVLLPLLLGTLLGGAFIVLRTVQDRTLRYPDEVWDRLGVPLLTVLPLAES